jgi:hypothetical protein
MTSDQLVSFFRPLTRIVDVATRAQEQLDRRLATRFSMFDVMVRSEHQLSDALRCLLDPKAGHGQGAKFLDSFLLLLRLRVSRSPGACEILREYPANSRSINRANPP